MKLFIAFMGLAATAAAVPKVDVNRLVTLETAEVASIVADEWGLRCISDGLEKLQFDGEMLAFDLKPSDITQHVRDQYFPNCLDAHWNKLWRILGPFRVAQREKQQGYSVDAKGDTTTARRKLQSASPRGIWLAQNNSRLSFGEQGDVYAQRTDEGSLYFNSNVDINGGLTVNGNPIYSAPVRCSAVNTTDSIGMLLTDVAPAHGDYIVASHVDCDIQTHYDSGYAYRPTPHNRW